MTPRRIRKNRRCGHCNAVLTTDADGLIAHSLERHGTASPPRPPSKGGYRFTQGDYMGAMAKILFGQRFKKRGRA